VLLSRSLNLGGSERQLAELARSLDRQQFDPVVACFTGGGMRADELRQAEIPVVEFPVRSFRSAATATVASSFFTWLRRSDVRIVHPFDVPTVLFAVPIARAARVPVVLSSQRGDRRLFSHAFQRALGLTDRLADSVVVNSDYIRRVLVSEFGLADQKIRTCPNGIDTTRFRPDGGSHRAEFPDDSLVVGVVTALRPEKSVETLVDAFARLRDERLRLVVVGDGPCRADLEALAHRSGLAGRCAFMPGTPDVAAWYRSIDVFVLPSLNESFSNSLMEAMACGCAVVASKVGGNPELVRHGETGLLFEAASAGDLTRQLDALVADPDARRRVAAAAVRAVRDGYSNERSASRFAALYQDMLARAATRA
jgi:L-malate glycosyltransferase